MNHPTSDRHQSPSEQRALEAIDTSAIIDDLLSLMAVPSVSGSSAEADIQHTLAKRMQLLGTDVDLWRMDVPTLMAAPAFPGVEVTRDEAWGLVAATHERTQRPALILQGHVDVVPPGSLDEWSLDPFSPVVRGDRVHGRGACDMKAGLVANIAAVQALARARITLRDPLAMHFVIGEEDGGLGAFGTLARGHTGDACIITEPTSGTVTTANAGALTFEIRVPGRATHASTAYEGVSAIDAYIGIHHALAELQVRRNQSVDPLMREYPIAYPISVGTLRAGDWASSVPDLLVCEGRLGLRLDEDPAEARRELEECVRGTAAQHPFLRDHPPLVTWPGGQYASGRTSIPGSRLVATVQEAHAAATGRARPRERGAPYGSDLRLYEQAGVPTMHYGPGDVRLAHSPRESVAVTEVVEVTRALVLTILRVCGTA
ncbi:ArgE/DapE family deacylase [Aeromicrobium sp. NPDC092404]|uniref:ArgE/DapE family deacylase n=1 Tax=Aeromicrobium sp. NPDC092404 TaxID=3154976 RepID=UPI00342A803D